MISKDCFAALLCAVGLGVFSGVAPVSHAQNAPPATGLQLWVRADAGVVTNATGLVEKWTDQSSHNNDATQTDDTLKPKLVPDAVNGKPAVRFDGSNDYLDVTSAPGLDITGDIATFAVIRAQDYANYNSIWGKTAGNLPAPNDWYLILGSGIPQFYRGDGTSSGIQPAQGERAIKANTYVVIGFRQAGTTATHYLNGSTNGVREVTVTPADTGTNLKIGSRDDLFTKMKGDIAELLIYNEALSDAEIVTAQDYLRNKYGITNTPPTVSISAPVNNSTQAAPATITVNVNASDPDGAISKVTLLANGRTIGTATAAPYKFPLTISTAGSLVLTAVATDNRDATSVTNITVTFTSASTPTLNANTHLKLWLKADAGTTLGASGGVTDWADQSGNNNNASQADETLAPTVGTLNGKTALHFDGADDYLDVADSASVSIIGDMAVFYVAQFDDFGGFRAVFGKTTGNQPQPFDYYLANGSGVPSFLRGGQDDAGANVAQGAGAAGGVMAKTPAVLGVQQAGTNVTHYLNGGAFGTGVITLTPLDADTPLKIGSRDDLFTKMKGDLGEILIYDAALSSNDVKNVQEYLAAKYGIPQVQLSNTLPKVQITAPTAGTNVPAGTAVTLTATASDTDGSITRVDFFANGIAVASDTTAPYNASYSNNFGGGVAITAVATDNLGQQTTSAAVNFTVTGGQTAAIPTSGLVLWLKPDQGVVTNASGALTEWQDSSGIGNNATQSDTGKQPVLNPAAVNGLAAVTFDGADDYLEVGSAPSVAITGDVTSFFVFNVTDYDNFRAIWAKTAGNLPAANDYYLVSGSGLPRFYHGNGAGGIAQVTGTEAPAIGTFVSAGFELEGTTATHFLNGADNGSGDLAATGVDLGGPLLVGTRADFVTKFKGDLAELVIYARALTEAERTQVQDYLQKKYFEAPSNQPTLSAATIAGCIFKPANAAAWIQAALALP
jgi:hypothetical protein